MSKDNFLVVLLLVTSNVIASVDTYPTLSTVGVTVYVIVPSPLNALASSAVIVTYPLESVSFVKSQTVSPLSFLPSTFTVIPSTPTSVLDSFTAFIFKSYPWHIFITVESVPSLESVPSNCFVSDSLYVS